MTINEKNHLLKKGGTLCVEGKNWCVISTTNTYDTIFFMQSLGWQLGSLKEDDVRDETLGRIERNLLFYYR